MARYKCWQCDGDGYNTNHYGPRDSIGYAYSGCTNCGGSGESDSLSGIRKGSGVSNKPDPGLVVNAPHRIKETEVGCFPKGTAILTPNGCVDIASISVGNIVYSYDKKSSNFVESKVLKVTRHSYSKIVILKFEGDTEIKTTSVHSILVDSKWKKAKALRKGDLVNFIDGDRVFLKHKESNMIEPVFNLVIDDNYNFIADNIIAHSFSYFVAPRIIIWKAISIMQGFLPKGVRK